MGLTPPSAALQVALDAGYKVLWSDMDTAWLKNFFELAPHDRDVVLVDDSEEENEQISDNTCTGATLSSQHLRLLLFCASWDLQLS